jgi:DNA-binding CsgD family transcriptional regulator
MSTPRCERSSSTIAPNLPSLRHLSEIASVVRLARRNERRCARTLDGTTMVRDMSGATSLHSPSELAPRDETSPRQAPVGEILDDIIALLERSDTDAALQYARAAADGFFHGRRDVHSAARPTPTRPPLTPREIEALRLLADGAMSQKDLARALQVSRNTVKSHVKSIYMKFGIHSRYEAIQIGRELGLLPVPEVLVAPERPPVQRLVLVGAPHGPRRHE